MGIFDFFKKNKKEDVKSESQNEQDLNEEKIKMDIVDKEYLSKIDVDIVDIQNTGIVKVIFNGQIDESNLDKAFSTVREKIINSPAKTKYIFDFENLKYINSMGLGQLSEIHMMIMEKEGDIIIIKSNPNILEILKYVRLDTVITFADSEEEAITIYKNQ